MRSVIKGNIVDFVPFFNARLDGEEISIAEDGDVSLTVDTGFSGGIALPLDIMNKIDSELAFYNTFTLATGEVVELPVYLGEVLIGNNKVETWFIPGDALLGMEFLSSAGTELSLNFNDETVELKK